MEKKNRNRREYNATWQKANHDHVLVERRKWRQKNREKLLTEARIYYASQTPETKKAKRQRQYTTEKNTEYGAKKRARRKGAPVNDFTLAQWQVMKEHYGHRCVYCRRKMQHLTQDHLTPLSKGGSHTASNIVPACRSCNSKKRTGPPLAPVQPLLL